MRGGGLKVPEGFAATRVATGAFPRRHRIRCGARAPGPSRGAPSTRRHRTGLFTTMSQANRVGKQNARERVLAEKVRRQRAERRKKQLTIGGVVVLVIAVAASVG